MLRDVVVKTHLIVLLGLVAVAPRPALGQEVPPPVPPPVIPEPSAAVVPPAAPASPAAIDRVTRREQIGLMEGLLAAAVRNGAQETARQIQAVQPGLLMFTGNARARGFYLEGYGVFFHVEIPAVQPSVGWILETLERSRVGRDAGGKPTLANMSEPPVLDADVLYTEAVQNKLVDAMINLRIDLLPDEWLTVAARDGAGPMPGEIYESITIVLRVRGADLADFLGGRITREALRKKVEVRGF